MVFTQIALTIIGMIVSASLGAHTLEPWVEAIENKLVLGLLALLFVVLVLIGSIASWELSGVLLWHLTPGVAGIVG